MTAMMREDMATRLDMVAVSGSPVFKAYARAFRAMVDLNEALHRFEEIQK